MGERLERAMTAKGLSAADLARLVDTTEATMSNWLNDRVKPEHVKAGMLMRIASSLGIDAQELLTGNRARTAVSEDQPDYSHPVQLDALTLALQLIEEALRESGKSLSPAKKAEAVQLTYELVIEGLPQAKVLRFARAAVG